MKATAEDLQRLGFGAVLHGERGELLMVIAPYMDEWHLIGCTVLRPDYGVWEDNWEVVSPVADLEDSE